MSELEKLRKEYDRVIITHDNESEVKTTSVLLVKHLKIHIGIARCNPGDTYNRKLGNAIAIGRAKLAEQIDNKVAKERDTERRNKLTYTISANDVVDLDESVLSFLPKKTKEKE